MERMNLAMIGIMATLFLQAPPPNANEAERQLEQRIERALEHSNAEQQIERAVEQSMRGSMQASSADARRDPDPDPDPDVNPQAVVDAIAKQMEQFNLPLYATLALLTPFAFVALVAFVAWLIYHRSQLKARNRMEFQRQLLEKFASGGELAAFLGAKGSQVFLEGMWTQQVNAKEKIMNTLKTGVVLTVLGLGTLGASWVRPSLLVFGILLVALGVGYLIATASSYRISREMGMLKDSEASSMDKPAAQP
ncbi:MAG TPA: hypothetical protein VIC04_06305 [Terriglobia bacterium]